MTDEAKTRSTDHRLKERVHAIPVLGTVLRTHVTHSSPLRVTVPVFPHVSGGRAPRDPLGPGDRIRGAGGRARPWKSFPGWGSRDLFAQIGGRTAGFVFMLATFALLYKVMPRHETTWRKVFPGAFLAAVLIEAANRRFSCT